jgi:hypothetical protein
MENLYTHISHGDAGALNLITQDPAAEQTEETGTEAVTPKQVEG